MITTMLWILVPLVVLAIGGWIAWQYLGAGRGLFGGNPAARIGVGEIATIDGKRKLLLIYRDGVEHLVMTGGPVDVVIEQGIQPSAQRRPSTAPETRSAPSFESRPSPQTAATGFEEAAADPQPAYSRLRQRPAPSAGAEPFPRPEQGSKSSGGGNR